MHFESTAKLNLCKMVIFPSKRIEILRFAEVVSK